MTTPLTTLDQGEKPAEFGMNDVMSTFKHARSKWDAILSKQGTIKRCAIIPLEAFLHNLNGVYQFGKVCPGRRINNNPLIWDPIHIYSCPVPSKLYCFSDSESIATTCVHFGRFSFQFRPCVIHVQSWVLNTMIRNPALLPNPIIHCFSDDVVLFFQRTYPV